jgi:hypothetical protein
VVSYLCWLAALGPACQPSLAADAGQAGEIRRLESRHLTLYTDLPVGEEVDALPALFDQAFSQWCGYFGVDEAKHGQWRVRGHLMKSRPRFEAAGLVPPGLRDFASGYAEADRLWCYDQSSAYYRRHLLLHEGTHAFMHALVGGVGPAWYAEGMAELLATHRVEDGRLVLNCFPRRAEEVSKWGRIEIVQTDYAARRALSLAKVFSYDPRVHPENEWYGWCWAAAAFFDGHPRYRSRFRPLHKLVASPNFTGEVERAFGEDWGRAQEDWRLYVANLDYGYDFSRMEIEPADGKPLAAGGARVRVAADRGWQSSAVRLEAGKKYRLRARGRYQVASEPRVWWCEPGGVTIRYYRGRPLGVLLAAVRGETGGDKASIGLLNPTAAGLETTLTPSRSGTLYLRINDSAGSLADNSGSLDVEVRPE